LLFTLALSFLTGILFGLVPAFQTSRPELVSTLKEKQGAQPFLLRRFSIRSLLVTTQVALSCLLLIVAVLFLRSLTNAITFDPGFDNRNLLLATLNVGRGLTKPQLQNFFQDLTTNISAQPGVRSTTWTKVVPLSGGGQRRGITIEGYQPQPGEDTELNTNVVGTNYFSTMEIPFLKGRDFNAGDREGSPGVVIVNQEFAQRYFSGDAVGKRIRTDSEKPFNEIVGVVGTIKHRNLRESSLPIVYLPLSQEMQGNMTLVVSTNVDPSTLRTNVTAAVHNLDRNIPVQVKTISEQINEAVAPDQSMAVLLGVFGGVALLLASVGIYGVVSYAVTQRTHEIGIRMALGARSTDVLRLVVREGMLLAIAGVMVGLIAAFGLTRLIGSLLFGLTPTDPPTFAIVTIGLLFIALVACFIPASRATKVDPLEALRYE
jgi:predicted permease